MFVGRLAHSFRSSAFSDEAINSATATITSDDEDDDDSAEGSADRMLVF